VFLQDEEVGAIEDILFSIMDWRYSMKDWRYSMRR
jgi:hypothetical protein